MKLISRLIMATFAAGILLLAPGGCPVDWAQLGVLAPTSDAYWVAQDEAIQLYDPAPAVPDLQEP
jgi:hypothetical protein